MNHGIGLLNISRPYLCSLFRKLDKGESIDKSSVKKGRKRIYRNEVCVEIAKCIQEQPLITDGMIAAKLGEKFERSFSRSSVQRIRNDETVMGEAGLSPYTFKVASNRSPTAQTLENKERRIRVAEDILGLPKKYKVVFIGSSVENSILQRAKKEKKLLST